MEFSPCSPKIFLTYGSDWYIRIWIEGITQPIVELCSDFNPIRSGKWMYETKWKHIPYVVVMPSAYWSPNNSTIIASTSRSSLCIWNIRKSTLKPASTRTFDSYVTVCRYLFHWFIDSTRSSRIWFNCFNRRFSKCGRSLVVGMADGSTHVCALEDMPFPPHFQYNVLEEVIQNAIRTKPELQLQLKILGYLGYPNNKK